MDLKNLKEMFATSVADAVSERLKNSLAVTAVRLDKEAIQIKIPDLKVASGNISVKLILTRNQGQMYSCKILLDDVPEVLKNIKITNKYKGDIFVYCYGEQPRNIHVVDWVKCKGASILAPLFYILKKY